MGCLSTLLCILLIAMFVVYGHVCILALVKPDTVTSRMFGRKIKMMDDLVTWIWESKA